MRPSHGLAQGLRSRGALGARATSSLGQRLARPQTALSSDRERYLGIHAFFRQLAVEQRPVRAAPLHFQRIRVLHISHSRHDRIKAPSEESHEELDDDEHVATDGKGKAAAQPTGKPESPSELALRDRMSHSLQSQSSQDLFHNYPRSLRELALEASQRRDRQAAERAATAAQSQQGQSGSSDSGQHHGHHHGHGSWTRPSKEDLLKYAGNFWTRMRIRFKWFTIRGFRRFNADDISAFFTLGSVGTIIWVVVGTTTFVSVVFAALNALNLQQWVARKLADYLTAETGVTVVFENAIVPKWKDGRISFKNVFISRRAHNDPEALKRDRDALVKGERRRRRRGTATTAGQGMAWEGMYYEDEEITAPMSDTARGRYLDDEVNSNYTMFDLSVDSIDVQLSFRKWWDGKGILKDAVIKGIRGIIDRRNVFWDPDKVYDPKAARRQHRRGDFELESLDVEDFLVTIYQPGDFRPFNYSVFSAHLPRLRKQWIFYDLLSAEHITGQVDGCLFSLHKPQSIGKTTERERELNHKSRWDQMSRIRIDGVSIDHIQSQQSELTGPMAWITSGRFDVVADIRFPREIPDDVDINTILAEIASNISDLVSGDGVVGADDDVVDRPIPGQHRLSGPAIKAPVAAIGPNAQKASASSGGAEESLRRTERELAEMAAELKSDNESKRAAAKKDVELAIPPPTVIIDLDVRFKDIKAAVPLFTKDLSYRNNAFVRPIVAFMNAHRTLIPIHARIVMDLSEFDGSMDLAQTGLLPIMSDKIYEALANHVSSQNANQQRLRNISAWSLQILADSALKLVTHVRDAFARTPVLAPTGADVDAAA